MAFTATAQLRVPSKNDIKKEIKKEVKSDSNSKKSETSSSQVSKSIPTEEVKSPAKGQISTFWKQIEKMRNHTDENNKQVVYSGGIQSAQMSLKNTKVKDASYDTSEMEKALKECQDVYNGVAGGKENARQDSQKNMAVLHEFFDTKTKNLTSYAYDSQEPDAAKINRVKTNMDNIAKYKRMAEDFAKQEIDKASFDFYLSYVKNVAKGAQEPLSVKDKWPNALFKMKILEDPTNSWSLAIFTYVQEIKAREAYYYAATVIYPNTPELEKALEWYKKAVDQIGSTDEVLAKINKSEGDYLKKVKFPSAKVNDVALEAEFKKHFNAMKYDESITKVNIQSTDWTIDRNELTGVIVGRSKQAFIATKQTNGDCYVTEFWIFQDYNGSGYGSFRNVTNNSFRSKLDCANVK